MSRTRLSTFLDGILEAGWLAAIIVTPLFFNIYSSRVFEPDKLTTLRSIALVMAGAWLVRWIEERAGGGEPPRFSWRTPLVLPTLFTVAVYLVSTLFSVTPHISFFGSYQRLQGTFTTLSYIVIFFILLDRMRTRAQVDRFLTTLILNSLPIALYGFVQHSGRDPLPWGGNVTRRIASNMGNAIFVAAYLIMAVPPTLGRIVTSFRSILTDPETGVMDVLRAAAYIFIVLVQMIAIWYTKSRGPLMGLLSGLGLWAFLGLLSLQRRARQEHPLQPSDLAKDLGRGLVFSLASLAVAGVVGGLAYLVVQAIAGAESSGLELAAVLAGLIGLVGAWLAFIVNRRGWRWLWMGTLALLVVFVILFLAVNPGGPLHEWARSHPSIGRLSRVLEAESGTGKVRSLIWEGGLDMLLPHEPIQFPPTTSHPDGWRDDPFNAVRPLIGYGPESMYVAYNSFYPPLLGHYESRTASPDRSHNETLDSLLITGVLGFVAYLWLFGSVFTLGMRWLGFLPSDWRRILFFVLMALFAVLAIVAVSLTVGPHFFGLAIPAGIVAGVFVYLIVYGFSVYWEGDAVVESHPQQILLIALLSTFVAHFVEINFGIAIASTRTTFWAMAGMFVLLGLQRIVIRETAEEEAQPEPETRSRRRRRRTNTRAARRPIPAWLWPSLGAALVGALILGTLAYDFVNNVERLSEPWSIFWRSLTIIAIPAREPPRFSPGILMVFLLTWLMTGLLSVSQMARRGLFDERKGEMWAAAGIILSISLSIGLVFGLILAGRHAALVNTTATSLNDVLQLAEQIANQVTTYYVFLATMILLGGLALTGERDLPRRWATPVGSMALLATLTSWLVLAIIGNATGAEDGLRLASLGLSLLLGLLIAGLIGLLAYFLAPTTSWKMEEGQWLWAVGLVAVVVLFLAPVISYRYNLTPIRADIIYKQADPWEKQNQWAGAVPHYERAIELVPYEDFYYLYLGRALLEYSSALGAENRSDQDYVLRQAEQVLLKAQDINPLNTDHSANMARMYRRWVVLPAGRPISSTLAGLSSDYYEVATGLSPNNPILWNEWATLHQDLLEDEARYDELIQHSLGIDDEFEQTWLIIGDIQVGQGELEAAIESYSTALEIAPRQPRVWSALGRLYLQLEEYEGAIDTFSEYLERWPDSRDAWDIHRLLAITYYQMGSVEQALAEMDLAIQIAPENRRAELEQTRIQMAGTSVVTETESSP
jgi:tetratricopeptide (TPR) repeat protein